MSVTETFVQFRVSVIPNNLPATRKQLTDFSHRLCLKYNKLKNQANNF